MTASRPDTMTGAGAGTLAPIDSAYKKPVHADLMLLPLLQ